MTFRVLIVFFVPCSYAVGQSPDSQVKSHLLQQITLNGERLVDSTQFSYDSIKSAPNAQREIPNGNLDSFQDLGQPVEDLTKEIDSITQWRNKRIQAQIEKVERLKSGTTERINTPKLPVGLEESELTGLIDNLEVSLPDTGIPFKDQLSIDLPGLENPLSNAIPGNDDLPGADLQGITEKVGEYKGQPAAIPSNMNKVSAMAEEQAVKIPEVSEAGKQLNEADKVTEMAGSLRDEQAVKDELVNQAQQQAIDHFQGKEEQLQQAMDLVSKYKKKYGSFQSFEEIAQRKGNPLRGTPFIERFMPGIAMQVHRKDAWMVDFYVYAGYRLYPRLTAGAGWNQRLAYDPDEYDFKPGLRIFGPRIFGEFRIGEGFSARLEAEYMNTRVPPQFSSGNADQNGRVWVFTSMAGVKKEFRFFKSIKGTMMLLYNLHDPDHRSPYVDKLTTRFGFEFPMKKKP